jgi:hypothetical protein
MLSQDALGTAPLAAPAVILTHQRSFSVRRLCQTPVLSVRRSLRRAPLQLARFNVLIHTEEIIGIVFFLDSD